MAKVKIKNLENVKNNIRREFDKIRRDPNLLTQIGEVTSEFIVKTSQTGKSPESGETFPSLSRSWMKTRERLKKFNSTGDFYLGTSKSNVTFTGKLLESLKKYRINQSEGLVIFDPEGSHPGYRTGGGRTKSITFKTLLTYLADQGRVVLVINKSLEKRVNVLVKKFIRDKIKKSKF